MMRSIHFICSGLMLVASARPSDQLWRPPGAVEFTVPEIDDYAVIDLIR